MQVLLECCTFKWKVHNSKYANVDEFANTSFNLTNTASCSLPHMNSCSFFIKRFNGSPNVAKLGMNRPVKFTNPIKLFTSETVCVGLVSRIAVTLPSATPIPCSDNNVSHELNLRHVEMTFINGLNECEFTSSSV